MLNAVKKHERHPNGYILEENLSLILRIAANNCDFYTLSDWESKTIADLLYKSLIVEVFKFDNICYLDLNHISSPYQWLFYYHQFANACRIIQTMPQTIDLTTWKYLNSDAWCESVKTTYLKEDAKFVLNELAKFATFPQLEKEWLKLFEIVKEQNIRIKTQNAMNQNSIELNIRNKTLFYENGQTANWYDILSVELHKDDIDPNIIKSINKLDIQESTSFIDRTSLLIISSFNKHDL